MPAQHALAFLFLAAIPVAAGIGDAAVFSVPALYLTAFLALDAVLGAAPLRTATIPLTVVPPAGHLIGYRVLLWAYIGAQLATNVWAIVLVAGGEDDARLAGLALAIGAAGGIFGMLAAHEMIHSRRLAERLLGSVMLAGLTALHFRIAHLQLHHRLAATEADPSSARRGESAYRFVLRSLVGQWRGVWRLERGRAWHANQALRDLVLTLALYGAILAALGPRAALFQLAQSAVAIFVLELFNYVAHYGLERRLLPDGRREKMAARHSWNTRHRFNNWALFNGGHHSDHHRAPARPYPHLRAEPDVPTLPFGYGGTMLLALVPPLWRRIMDERLKPWRAHAAAPPVPRPGAAATARCRR